MLKQIKNDEPTFTNAKRPSKRLIAENYYESQWKENPEQFNPQETALKRNSFSLLKSFFSEAVKDKICVDIGSGYGKLSEHLARLGADVTAVDIAKTALTHLEPHLKIKKEQHFVPYTVLPDDHFDYVIASNFIAELPDEEYRLFFSELARIVKPTGQIILATPLDIYSEDALEKLLYLAETELNLESLKLSYHRIYIQFLKLVPWIENLDFLLSPLEKLTQFIYDREGASYAIFTARRRPIFVQEPPTEPIPKKTVWE